MNNELGGIASIDEIMVGLWRLTSEEHELEVLASKIYRMTRKDILHSVPGRKGIYSTSKGAPQNTADESESEKTNQSEKLRKAAQSLGFDDFELNFKTKLKLISKFKTQKKNKK